MLAIKKLGSREGKEGLVHRHTTHCTIEVNLPPPHPVCPWGSSVTSPQLRQERKLKRKHGGCGEKGPATPISNKDAVRGKEAAAPFKVQEKT